MPNQHMQSTSSIHHCHLHRPLKTRLLQLPLSQPRRLPNTASAAYPKFTHTGRYQNAQTSSYHSCPEITSLAKNPRVHPLQSPVPNLKFPAVFPAHTYLRELFTIQPTRSTRSSPYLDHWSLLISCSPTEPYPSLHLVFGMTYHLNSAPFLYLHHRHCQSQDIIFIRQPYLSPRAFHSKLKSNFFKHS